MSGLCDPRFHVSFSSAMGVRRSSLALLVAVTLGGCGPSAAPSTREPTSAETVALPPPIAVVDCPSDAAQCEELAVANECTTGAEDFDGFEDADGCADVDNDRDGIPDASDKCPNEPETYNGIDDEDGCPDKSVCFFGGPSAITIFDVVRFDDKGVKIAAASLPILDALATALKGNPQIQLVQIEGHSDERGDAKVNLAITEKRAKAVMDVLIAKGVPKDRLRAKGFGEYCPVDPAHDEQAWAKNRRVAFRIAKYDDQKDYEELGCAEAKANGVVSYRVP